MPEVFLEAAIRDKILGAMRDDEILDLVKKIIAIPSHRSHPRMETDVAEFIMREFQAAGIETFLQEVEPGRCNVIGRLGGGDGTRIMLNGHIDTVPGEGMADPFAPSVRDGILHGRGAADMKGGVAGMVYAMLSLKRAGVALPGEVIFAGVVAEEEATSAGTLYILDRGPAADMVVVGEATNLEVVIAHKGFDNYGIDVKGVAAHSSRPERGVNAIAGAAAVIRAIQEELIPLTSRRQHPYLTPPTINVAAIQGAAKNDSAFFSGDMTHIPGAIVPDHCRIYIDRRRLPGEDMDDIVEDFRRVIRDLQKNDPTLDAAAYHIKPNGSLPTHPPLDASPDSPLVRQCLHWAEYVLGGKPKPIGRPGGWTEAALFNELNRIPAIVYGPGDPATAHSNTEQVPVSQLTNSARVYALLAASAASLPRQ